MQVLVVVPTLGERALEELLAALRRECDALRATGYAATALVLHNGEWSAALAQACEAAGVSYANHVPRGFSAIRNAALDRAAAAECDVLVMIDDDEIPVSGWLAALVSPVAADADVVVGPVVTAWPEGTPPRFARSDLPRAAPQLPDGPIDLDLRSGNCALRVAALGAVRFDARYNRSGGEDTAFFRQVRAAGARCHWSQAAEVVELVDADRISLRYFARRAFAQGGALVAIRSAAPSPDDASAASIVRTRLARAARLAAWGVTRRRTNHALEAACELAFVVGFGAGELRDARGRRSG